jgi:hypothetical protein
MNEPEIYILSTVVLELRDPFGHTASLDMLGAMDGETDDCVTEKSGATSALVSHL